MSRYRLQPSPEQETALREHCAHARFVWNLAVEQHSWWRKGRRSAPSFPEQCRQLTEARRESEWLRAGSSLVQQQALRDFDQAMKNFFGGTHRKPTWRKARRNEGFRVVGSHASSVENLNRRWSRVLIPKVGWVRFRRSRPVLAARSYRVTMDASGRWHIAFATPPEPIPAPGTGEIVGIDRGVAVSAALSTGEVLTAPRPGPGRRGRILRLQRKLRRSKRGSNRYVKTRLAAARLHAREKDARKDWAEKTSTDIARRFDLIRVEDLHIAKMVGSGRGTLAEPGRNVCQKAGLNREILASGWGLLVRRLEQKAPGRVEKINPAYTSQRCSACGQVDGKSRESQARFRCTACGYACHADVNAARNIAAGHPAHLPCPLHARGGFRDAGPVNREPQLSLLAS